MSRTIAIVGGGYCGTLLTTLLLRNWDAGPVRLMMFEPSAAPGRGVAYAKRNHPFLLNVAAGRMPAEPGDPLAFLRHARRHAPECTEEDFLPREWYGEYLEGMLQRARHEALTEARLEVRHSRVIGVRRSSPGRPLHVELDDGTACAADKVVLATGHGPPARPACVRDLAAADGYLHDPWGSELGFAAGERLLLIGTSLTMVDVLLAADAAAGRPAVVHALSRRGIIPPPQARVRAGAADAGEASLLLDAATSLRGLTRTVRTLVADTQANGGDWREVVVRVRELSPRIWHCMPEAERRRFLRHARTIWDVHRHRLPPASWARVARHREEGWLQVHAGRIVHVVRGDDGLKVRWRPRGTVDERELTVDRIVNCTGPDHDLDRTRDPLYAGLLRDGLACRDPLHLGLRTGPRRELVDASGRPSSDFYYLGPMLRADHWEATAALELRDHAVRLAAHLARPDPQR